MEFGDILRQIRAERGLSQDELAALLGTTKQVISRYETKKRVPRLSVVTAFAQKLGLPVSALSGEEAIMPPELMPVSGMRRVPILGSAACGEPIYKPGDGTEFVTVEDDFPCDFALIAEHLGEQAESAMTDEMTVIVGDDAGTFLTAMLQRVQAKIGES